MALDAHDPLARVRAALSFAPAPGAFGGDHALNATAGAATAADLAQAIPAAVLIGLIARPDGATVLLTERALHLRAHSGQIAFPGGKIDPHDAGPVGAALREAHEEIGLGAEHVDPLGVLEPYLSGSGYRITPVVAEIRTPFGLAINHDEVADVFEAPLSFLLDPANHRRQSREWRGQMRHYYEMPWRNRYIWGVTAGILRNLSERLGR